MAEVDELVSNKKGIFSKLISKIPNKKVLFLIGIVALGIVIAVVSIVIVLRFIKIGGLLNKCIIKGVKSGKTSLVIRQSGAGPKQILKTMDMNKGLEFTYSLWININSLEYNKDKKLKPIFYKSQKETLVDVSDGDYAPGVFLLDTNTLRIAMQTGLNEAKKMEFIDVDNIPLKKWFHLGLFIKQQSMDVYINGQMLQSKRFTVPPSQNDGNLYITTDGGFDGTISNMKFFAYRISYDKLNKILKDGPQTGRKCETDDLPPYFHDKWWIFR